MNLFPFITDEHRMIQQAAREFAQKEILPIAAEHVGARLDLAPHQQVTLDGPDPLTLTIHDLN